MQRHKVGWAGMAALVAAMATGMGGCDVLDSNEQRCTAAAYDAGLRVWFLGPDEMPLPDVTLEIVLHVDGDVYTLACGRPDPESTFYCEDAEGGGEHRIRPEELSKGAFSLRIWRIDGSDELGPEEVRVEAFSGDAPLVDQTFMPTYETDEPNGEGCGFVDHRVEETIVIDATQ